MDTIETNALLNNELSQLTYNGKDLMIPKDDKSNLYMGIGFWSHKKGYLSKGLPIDVMQMLLPAAMLKCQISETHLGSNPKVILLIADSLAIQEGADPKEVTDLIQIYKRSLEPLLALLKLTDYAEIVLSSDLEKDNQYQIVLKKIEDSPKVQELKQKDPDHYAYIRTQSAISCYMNENKNVGVKISWIYESSSNKIGRLAPEYLTEWDELKFDAHYKAICPDSILQYLYVKSGLKHTQANTKHMQITPCSPYYAANESEHMIIQTQKKAEKPISSLQPREIKQWISVIKTCDTLAKANLVNTEIISNSYDAKKSNSNNVSNTLTLWVNLPLLKGNFMKKI